MLAGKIPKKVVMINFFREIPIIGEAIFINQFGKIGVNLILIIHLKNTKNQNYFS